MVSLFTGASQASDLHEQKLTEALKLNPFAWIELITKGTIKVRKNGGKEVMYFHYEIFAGHFLNFSLTFSVTEFLLPVWKQGVKSFLTSYVSV